MPFENQIEMAWAATLVLVLLVLTANLIGQSFSRRSGQQYSIGVKVHDPVN